MGGTRITFRGLSVDCGRSSDRLINSNLFIKQAGKATEPPTDVVCDRCSLRRLGRAHGQRPDLRALRDHELDALPRALPAADARRRRRARSDPVVAGNSIRQCGPGQDRARRGQPHRRLRRPARAHRALPRPGARIARDRRGDAPYGSRKFRARRGDEERAHRPLPAHAAAADRRGRAAALRRDRRPGASSRASSRTCCSRAAGSRLVAKVLRRPLVRRPARDAAGATPRAGWIGVQRVDARPPLEGRSSAARSTATLVRLAGARRARLLPRPRATPLRLP